MRKLFYGITSCLIFIITACEGDNHSKVQSFVETFAGYVNAGRLDSIKAVYPAVNFDSIAHVSTDSIKIDDTAGLTRVDFGGGKWIEIQEGEDGNLIVVASKGIAAFPEDKFQLAVNTGMLNDSISDIKAQELLNDSTYFAWLNDKAKESNNNVFSVKTGKPKVKYYGEGDGLLTMPITIQNNLPVAFNGSEYEISYTLIYYDYLGHISPELEGYYKRKTKTVKMKGEDIGPNKSITMTIKKYGDKITNVKAYPKLSQEQFKNQFYNPTGNEYQEYLNSKK